MPATVQAAHAALLSGASGAKIHPALAECHTSMRMLEVFTLAGEAAGAYPIGKPLRPGTVILGGYLLSSVSLGAATLAIGITGTPAKYRAAAAFTTPDAPTWFGIATACGTPLTAEEQIIMTVAAAALPASGRLIIGLYGNAVN